MRTDIDSLSGAVLKTVAEDIRKKRLKQNKSVIIREDNALFIINSHGKKKIRDLDVQKEY